MTTKPALSMAERLQLALEAAGEALACTDAQGRVQWSTRAFASLLGRPPDQVLGAFIFDLLPLARDSSAKALSKHTEVAGAFRRNGVALAFHGSWGIMEGEAPAGLFTLRPASETEDQFRMLVDGVKDYALVMLDPNGRIISWNSGAERIKGYKAEEIVGRSFEIFYSQEERAAGIPQAILRDAASTGRLERDGVWRVRKDGSRFVANIVITALRDETQRLRGFCAVTRDVTDIHHKTMELTRSNAELDRFASAASHDLLEPLRKITAFGEILEKHSGAALDEKGLDFLRRMRNAALRMTRLVEDLLQYSRVFGDNKPLEAVDLNQVASDLLADYESKISASKARVTVDKLPIVQAHRFQMHQLLQNLLDNALKFRDSARPPVVTVKAEPGKPGFVDLVVADNGIGLDMKDAEKIFQPFVRLHTRTEYEGTGLGLALCRRIAARHGGWIRAEGERGAGCRFIVTLPMRSQA